MDSWAVVYREPVGRYLANHARGAQDPSMQRTFASPWQSGRLPGRAETAARAVPFQLGARGSGLVRTYVPTAGRARATAAIVVRAWRVRSKPISE